MRFLLIQRSAPRLFVAALALSAASPGQACSPPLVMDDAGFARSHVKRLPTNAKGVIFLPPVSTLRATDFRITSSNDHRPLRLSVRPVKGTSWVRLEPAGGFRPGAVYHFSYLLKHAQWRHASEQTVTIDDRVISTAGGYTFEPVTQPINRVASVLTYHGSCVKPAPVVLQEFAHLIPEQLMPYRDALHYDVHPPIVVASREENRDPGVEEWGARSRPALYGWLYLGERYRGGQREAVFAPCGNRWDRVRMRSSIAFPELDDERHLTRETVVDLRRGAGGDCGELEALQQSIQAEAPETVLRDVCRIPFSPGANGEPRRLADMRVEDWERALELPIGDMWPTCDLVALGYLWRYVKREPAPAIVDRIGAALQRGFGASNLERREHAVHALVYLLDQLPERYRRSTGFRLLKPLQPSLINELATSRHTRPEELTRLIVAGGRLPPSMRARVTSIASGSTKAAIQAKGILALTAN